jgi:hypothetical protein
MVEQSSIVSLQPTSDYLNKPIGRGDTSKATRELWLKLARAHLCSMMVVGWHSALRANTLLRAELDWLTVDANMLLFAADREKTHEQGFVAHLYPTKDPLICPQKHLEAWLSLRATYVEDNCDLLWPSPTIVNGVVVLVDHLERSRSRTRAKRDSDVTSARETELIEFEAYRPAYQAYQRRLAKLGELAGIEVAPDRFIGTHSTRRGIITELRANNVDLQVIADQISGHRSLEALRGYDDSSRRREHPIIKLQL